MRKYVLKTVSQLECLDVTESVLDMRVNDQLSQSQYFSTQMERVTETRLLALLCGECFNWLQIEIIV
jgi:hypothetical protein